MYNSSKKLEKDKVINYLYEKYKLHVFISQLKCYNYKFYNNWNIWIHNINNNNWDIKSYKQIYKK